MKFIYLKFNVETFSNEKHKVGLFSRLLINLLKKIIPQANPDFDDKIANVTTWLIEIAEEIPQREIGLDKNNNVIMIMPWKDNSGYWTDNSLELKDFITSLNSSFISESEFNQFWEAFASTY